METKKYIRYWETYQSLNDRYVRVVAQLTLAMRIFCYSFLVGIIAKEDDGILTIGSHIFDSDFINLTTNLTLFFVFIDLFQHAAYMLGTFLVLGNKRSKYKKYLKDGINKKYEADKDETEKIIRLTKVDIFLINWFPTALYGLKSITILAIILVFGWNISIE